MTHDDALAFAEEWVAAWNAHDLSRIMAHYADDFEMTSPYIIALAAVPCGTLIGKVAVGAYWSEALERFPDLRFDLLGAYAGVNSVAIQYRGVRGIRACEVLHFGERGLVEKAVAHYQA